jgi:transglutaminase-like putative cysteine protease
LNIQLGKYLEPTFIVDSDNPAIIEKAENLSKGQKNDIGKAIALFYFVRDEIKYNIYTKKSSPEDFRASNTLLKKDGYCVQKAVLLAALARAIGIPAGIGFARIKNNLMPEKTLKWLTINILPFHGFCELHVGEKWVKATPAFDLTMCKNGKIVPVEFDGINNAMLNPHNLDGQLHIEYLKYFGRYPDVPMDKLHSLVIKYFGKKFLNPEINPN